MAYHIRGAVAAVACALAATVPAGHAARSLPPAQAVTASSPQATSQPPASQAPTQASLPARAAGTLPDHADGAVDYRIDVTLDETTKQIQGRERLTWKNPGTEPVADLWFHLYLNAFKNTKSTFMTESGGQLRGDRMRDGAWGWIDVTSATLAGSGHDLLPGATFEHPDDDNADDRTVWRLALPSAVPPGESVTLDLAFHAQLPQVFARTGYAGDYFLVGQWFPKLGVYEPAGMRGRQAAGWNCHQFHANSEFYADFGRFLVNITLPSRFVVGATGVRTARTDHPNGTTTHTYEQADVHDFAWTADPGFVEVRRTFSADRDVTAEEYAEAARLVNRPLDQVRLSDVEMILLLQPEHRAQADRHFRAVKASLKYYGLWYGRYPYRTLTVVDPSAEGNGSGGMEYPTFITAGTSALASYWPFRDLLGPEGVTVHEFGHQFWYGMVANNEFEEAWLDEGFTSYSTGLVMEKEYGFGLVPHPSVSEADVLRMMNTPGEEYSAIRQPAWSYPGTYSFYAYFKPEIVLRTLEHHLGRDTMARVMRRYQERWRFRHPGSDDFFAVVNEVTGQDLPWLKQAIEGTAAPDYEVASVSASEAAEPVGVFDEGGKRLTKKGRTETAAEDGSTFRNVVLVRRSGDIVIPVEIALTFEGGRRERIQWDGTEPWKRFVLNRPYRLEAADVDPDRKLEIDVDWLNNARRVEADRRPAAKLTAAVMFVVQTILGCLGS